MANFKNYPIKDFSTDQKFLADDPNQVVRVTGQSMLDANIEAMKKSGKVVNSIDTLTEAIAGDYLSGIYLLVGGGVVTLDGDQAIYRVSDAGSGGIVMANGNELVLLFNSGVGAIDSVASLFGLTGLADQQISLKGWHPDSDVGGGTLYWDSVALKSTHNGGTIFSPTVPWTTTTADYLNAVGETDGAGTGVWVRLGSGFIAPEMFGILLDGADETNTLQMMLLALKNTGVTLHFEGTKTLQVSQTCEFEGFNVVADDLEIKAFSSLASTFAGNGAIRTINCNWNGLTVVYTSGGMTLSAGSTTFRQDSGDVEGVTVYSEMDEAYLHLTGNCQCKVVGGRSRGFRSRMRADEPTKLDVEYFNTGIAYTDKEVLTPIVVPTDSRAVHIFPDQIPITSQVDVKITGNYSWKNAGWVGNVGTANNRDMTNCNITSDCVNAGYYLDENGARQNGSGAGTHLTIEACPSVTTLANSRECRGYNIAVTKGSHNAYINGRSFGNGGDPNISVNDCNDVIVDGVHSGGTVGVSVGEDGAQSDNCKIIATLKDITQEPIRVSSAKNTIFSGAAIGEPFSSVNGSWSGLGKLYPLVKALNEQYSAQDISVVGATIVGKFTHEVLEIGNGTSGGDGKLRVRSEGNTYSACLIPRENTENSSFIDEVAKGTDTWQRVTVNNGTTGYANTGLLTIPDGSTNSITDINSKIADLTALQDTGETLEETLKRYCLLTYLKYDSAMPRDASTVCRFGITDRTNASDTEKTFFAIFNSYESVIGRPLKNGEFIPLTDNLYEFLFSSADPSALTKFNFIAGTASRGFDIVITEPVIVDIGNYEND